MIRVNQIKMDLNHSSEELKKKVAKALRIDGAAIEKLEVVKQSIDARKKPTLFYTYSVDVIVKNEEKVVKRANNPQVSLVKQEHYKFPKAGAEELKKRPVIIGSGPAGLFCTYFLALNGYRPILLERGQEADKRKESVESFWNGGKLNPNSNVQFGEGGAGTFSDGKLNTLVKDKYGRNKEVLRIFVEAGASEKIQYENKPHIGTDVLIHVVKNMREQIIANGGEVWFESQVTDFCIQNGKITGVEINHEKVLPVEVVVLAIGHSARDTFETLLEKKVGMEAKSFAVGFRVEHLQSKINQSQYGMEQLENLSAAPYKVVAKASNGRGVYSFCMCPGGYVVNASSEEGRLAVNGMSYQDRGGQNANSAIIVSVTPEDFGSTEPLAGIAFQRKLEEKAYVLGNGKVPVQLWKDFKADKVSKKEEFSYEPAIKGAYQLSNLREILPKECNQAFMEGMEQFGHMIKGFDEGDTILSGVESRTSSPVRIHREDESFESNIRGLYPCGEGAGYAGGITSAAMDGMKVAEAIARKYKKFG